MILLYLQLLLLATIFYFFAVVVDAVAACLLLQKTDAKFCSFIIFDAAEFHFTWKRKKMKQI